MYSGAVIGGRGDEDKVLAHIEKCENGYVLVLVQPVAAPDPEPETSELRGPDGDLIMRATANVPAFRSHYAEPPKPRTLIATSFSELVDWLEDHFEPRQQR